MYNYPHLAYVSSDSNDEIYKEKLYYLGNYGIIWQHYQMVNDNSPLLNLIMFDGAVASQDSSKYYAKGFIHKSLLPQIITHLHNMTMFINYRFTVKDGEIIDHGNNSPIVNMHGSIQTYLGVHPKQKLYWDLDSYNKTMKRQLLQSYYHIQFTFINDNQTLENILYDACQLAEVDPESSNVPDVEFDADNGVLALLQARIHMLTPGVSHPINECDICMAQDEINHGQYLDDTIVDNNEECKIMLQSCGLTFFEEIITTPSEPQEIFPM
jgi:hypothetical protein